MPKHPDTHNVHQQIYFLVFLVHSLMVLGIMSTTEATATLALCYAVLSMA